MSDPVQPPKPTEGAASTTTTTSASAPKPPKPVQRNAALRMLGIPALPTKLPSRNWMIFWTLTTTISAAIIYDRREKRRAIAKWKHSVEHLAKEPLQDKLGLSQTRKLTIYLSAPPGDGLRVAQDHYTEYVKPILAASGLDWEFVQGRQEGDVRAVVAERVRKIRRGFGTNEEKDPDREPTKDELIEMYRHGRGIPDYDGVRGDVVIGRHTWKEYLRGLHEGWLGPLTAPKEPEPITAAPTPTESSASSTEEGAEKPAEDKPAEEKKEEEAPKPPTRPPQPKPYNTTADYPTACLDLLTPAQFTPSAPIREPHILGFLNTPTRMVRFFNQRKLANDIGREVAAVCLCTYREFQLEQNPEAESAAQQVQYEQEKELAWEEKDWVKSVWKEDEPPKEGEPPKVATEKILAKPVVMDPRVAARMRRFQLSPEDEDRAASIKVPEEEVEGWTKGTLRSLWRWGAGKFNKEPKPWEGLE